MNKVGKFIEWHKARMGHDIGTLLGIEAVNELAYNRDALVERVAELEALVKVAFMEGLTSGYSCGLSDGQSYSSNRCSLDKDDEWQCSDAKSSLEKSK